MKITTKRDRWVDVHLILECQEELDVLRYCLNKVEESGAAFGPEPTLSPRKHAFLRDILKAMKGY